MATSNRVRAVARARLVEAELVDALVKAEQAVDAAKTELARVKAAAKVADIKARLAAVRRIIRPRRKRQDNGLFGLGVFGL